MFAQRRWLTENWQRHYRDQYKKADSTDAFGDSWRGPYQPDTADGQTTSPQSPPFTLPRTLDQTMPPLQSPQNPTLDRSQSAPAAMEQASASGQCQVQPGVQELPQPSSPVQDGASIPHQVQPPPPHNGSKVSPTPSPSAHVIHTPADGTTPSQDPGGDLLQGAAEGNTELDELVSTSMLPYQERLSPVHPMEQEVNEPEMAVRMETSPSATSQTDSVEMESPTALHSVVSSERDQPEGERCSSSDSIPSLAAALMELHELLVSNNCAQSQNRSTSCSPLDPFRQDVEKMSPKPCTLTPENTPHNNSIAITAISEPCDAKANYAAAAAVSDEEPTKCLAPNLSDQEEHLCRDETQIVERQEPLQVPDGCEERGADGASNISLSQPETEVPPSPAVDLEFREPPEGQHGRGVADGQASGTNTRDALGLQTEHTFLSPLSIAVDSQEDFSGMLSSSVPPPPPPQPSSQAPLPPPPHPFIEQFPAEHIERIEAAGFSAREAVEALEEAHGVVELALLALLARNITVPT
ncbi:protein DDI1 homolog 2 isoform 1-T1 [Pholidichthys leucotaenia]